MIFDVTQARAADEADQRMLQQLSEKLNRKQRQLEARGWQGEGVYQWLCLIAGRWLRRYSAQTPTDPDWTVTGWSIGRKFQGPMISFDITGNRVKVDNREGHKAWLKQNRLA